MVSNELLQEKQDQIELLQDLLEKEREKLHAAEKQVADLNEEFVIVQEKLKRAEDDKDKLRQKQKENIFKISTLNEKIFDKDEKIE